MSVFRNLSIKFKLFLVYAVITLIIFTISFFLLFFHIRKDIEHRIKEELNTSNQIITDMVETIATVSIKNHLRALAEKQQEMILHFYQRFQAGEISELEAKAKAEQAIFSQTVGDTGYLYCVDSKGVAVVHPDNRVAGQNFSHRRFVQKQIQKKEGYLEYNWKNPGEPNERPKALYMTYFKPWDWIISVTTYKSELNKLVNVNDFKDRILNLRFGKTGYSFIYDFQGNSVIHPELTGNVLGLLDANGLPVARQMIQLKKGYLTYWWKNPSEKEPREKFVAFDYIPGVDWIVASSSYTREMFAPLYEMQKAFFLILFLVFVITGAASLVINSFITKPLENFVRRFEKIAVDSWTSPLVYKRKDEIGKLSSSVNTFLDRLNMYRNELISEIRMHKETEKELRESEELMRNLIEQSPLSIQILNREGHTIRVNRSWEKLWGTTREEISEAGFNILHDEQARELGIVSCLESAFKGETVFFPAREYDASPIVEKGNKRWVTANIYPVKDRSGFVHTVVLIQTDITAQKKADDEIKKLNEFRASIIDSLDIWLSVVDSERNIVVWNKAAEKISGYDKNEVLGHNKVWDWLYPDKTYWEKVMADSGEIFKKAGVINDFETKITHKDGSERTISWHTHILIQNDEHGTQFINTGRDLTEQRLTEAALRESEERYKSLYNNIPIGLFRITLEGQVQECNPSFLNMLDFPENKNLDEYTVADFYKIPDEREQLLDKIAKDGFVQNFELEAKIFKDEKKFVSINAVLVKEDGGGAWFDGTVEDITQRKLAEEEAEELKKQMLQSQKMEALGVLAGGIAHDFNNILSALMGFTDLAQLEAGDNKILERYLNSISEAGFRARDLVRHILTFSRKTDIVKQPIFIDPIIKETLKFIRASFPADIEIQEELREKQSRVFGNASQFHQVLMNLFTNAGYAMKGKGGKLEVVLDTIQIDQSDTLQLKDISPGRYLNLMVSDNGRGIQKEYIDRIFEPFFTTKEREEGTGMGLSTVYGIVKEMGGTISVYSEVGIGTTFKMLIPEHRHAEQNETVSKTKLKTGDGRILIVDDEPPVLEVSQGILSRLGYSVTTAGSGHDALEKIKAEPLYFDLILTDMTMPGINGLELSRQIKSINPELPIILCTGFSHELTKEMCRAAGIVHMVMKPMIAGELSTAVYDALNRE